MEKKKIRPEYCTLIGNFSKNRPRFFFYAVGTCFRADVPWANSISANKIRQKT